MFNNDLLHEVVIKVIISKLLVLARRLQVVYKNANDVWPPFKPVSILSLNTSASSKHVGILRLRKQVDEVTPIKQAVDISLEKIHVTMLFFMFEAFGVISKQINTTVKNRFREIIHVNDRPNMLPYRTPDSTGSLMFIYLCI